MAGHQAKGTVHPLVPEFILDRLAANEHQGEFEGAAMFVDISGFSQMTDELMRSGQHGAEVLAEIMRDIFDPLISISLGHGAFIANLAGDACTAIFESNDSLVHALAASLEIQKAIKAIGELSNAYGRWPISAKIGLAAEKVTWGVISAEDGGRMAYYIGGPAVLACGDAEHHAAAGDLVLNGPAFEAAKNLVAAEPAGDFFRITQVTGLLPASSEIEPASLNAQALCRFFPEDLVLEQQPDEFRHVISLFIQLPTVRTERQLEVFMDSLFRLQDRYGGLLNRLDFGDKGTHLLLFWGAPRAFEDDIDRALNFILELQAQTSIPIRAGLTYRISHAGYIGSALREEYTCYGRGVNLAARLMQHAPRGEIWVDSEIARRAAARFDIESEGTHTFKGFAEPQEVFALFEPIEDSQAGSRAFFVGREAELGRLHDFLQPLAKQHFAGAFLLTGDAGIGKSRLIAELRPQLEFEHAWALCQCDQLVQESFNPFRYLLRLYFEQSSTQSVSRNKRGFSRRLDSLILATDDPVLADELDRTRSFLGALIDLDWPDSLYEQLEAQGRYENTVTSLISLLLAESLQQPVVLHLEDAHWLDTDSAAVLSQLFAILEANPDDEYPIALLATARPQEVLSIGAGIDAEQLILGRLESANHAELAQAILRRPVRQELLDLVEMKGEGNPFYIEQILHYLKDQNHLVEQEDETLALHPDLISQPARVLPGDVRALLVARLDRLTREVRELVQQASVLGREFELRLLKALAGGSGEIQLQVQRAERQAIWQALDELRYLFRHALLRDTAYRMQVRARRQELHTLVVKTFERLHQDDLSDVYHELAFHAERSGDASAAVKYLYAAADKAAKDYQNAQALDLYTRALSADSQLDPETRYDILLAREDIGYRLGERETQKQDLAALESLTDHLRPEQRATILFRKARLADETGDFESQIGHAKVGLELAQAEGLPDVAAQAQIQWGTALYWQGQYLEAHDHHKSALEKFSESDNFRGMGDARYHMAEADVHLANLDQALGHLRDGLSLDRKIGSAQREASTLNMIGIVHEHRFEPYEARHSLLAAMEINVRIGNRRGQASNHNNLGVNSDNLGNYSRALDHFETALQINREILSKQSVTISLSNIAQIQLKLGNKTEALEFASGAVGLARELGYRFMVATGLAVQGDVLANQEAWEQAGNAYEESLKRFKDLNQETSTLWPGLGLLECAQANDSQAYLDENRDEVFERLLTGDLNGLENPKGYLWRSYQLAQKLQDPRAELLLSRGREFILDQASRIADKKIRRSFLENVPEHRLILNESPGD
jgi:class 3 adenylate cyclase/tetratricopeptide (TPR) repeat protein